MKILMTADTVGGVWHYALELSRALAPFEVTVALATLGRPLTADQRDAVAKISNMEVFEGRYKLSWMKGSSRDVEEAGTWLLSLAAQLRPAVIHLNDYAYGALPWQAPVLLVGHSCVLSWWEAVRGEPVPAEWQRYRQEATAGLHAADRVIAPTWAMLTSLERFYGPLPKGRVIPNARRAYDYVPGEKYPLILSAGRLWDEAKNIAALAAVAPNLPWPVYIAGEEEHPDGGRSDFAGVQRLGRLPPARLAHWYAQASIYALPARYEPFGLSVLEAALAGCALVLGDISSLREVWGEAALFVAPDDTRALQAALQALINDPRRCARYAQRARRRAVSLTPERMVGDYWAVYRELNGVSGLRKAGPVYDAVYSLPVRGIS